MLKYLYFVFWYIFSKARKRKIPFNSVVCISDNKSYQQLFEEIKYCYRAGARTIRFDGNPLTWKDSDNRNLESIVNIAQKIGFGSISLFWNPVEELSTSVTNIWVQLDETMVNLGDKDFTDLQKKVIENIAKIKNKNVFAIFTVNKNNYTKIENLLKFVAGNPKIKTIGFDFLESSDDAENGLPEELKCFVIDNIIEFKKRAFPILNTYRSLVNEKNINKRLPNVALVFDFDSKSYEMETFSVLHPVIKQHISQ